MPRHPDLAKTETGMTLQRADPNGGDPILALKDILSALEDDFDYTVLDTPPSHQVHDQQRPRYSRRAGNPGGGASAYGESGLQRALEAFPQAVAR